MDVTKQTRAEMEEAARLLESAWQSVSAALQYIEWDGELNLYEKYTELTGTMDADLIHIADTLNNAFNVIGLALEDMDARK